MRARYALPILSALSFATAAFADPAPGTIMKVTPPNKSAEGGKVDPSVVCAQKYRLQAAELTMLGASLKLTDAQKPVFATWRKTRLDLFQAIPCPEPSLGLDVPAPKRVENQITIMNATMAGLRKELPATQALYAALTPEQRAIFDGPIKLAAPPPAAPNAAPAPSH
ncbi:MAG TPA: Spy/CpxP family protein refolding chaperone [Rhizomicrobium sp.]|nr:Spy/CpxP family protein refolding chaperone [Rhizomicrobium sp.]